MGRTTLLVYAARLKAKATKLSAKHPELVVVEEDEFRRRHLVVTGKQAVGMLSTLKGRKRLAALVAVNSQESWSRSYECAEIKVAHADFTGASLDGANLDRVSFVKCKLSGGFAQESRPHSRCSELRLSRCDDRGGVG